MCTDDCTHLYSQETSKNIINIEQFLNSDIESGIQGTTTSMHFLEVLKFNINLYGLI